MAFSGPSVSGERGGRSQRNGELGRLEMRETKAECNQVGVPLELCGEMGDAVCAAQHLTSST